MPAPCNTGRRLREYLNAHRPARIGETEWLAVLQEFATVPEGRLRELLRRTGIPFEQPWCGIRQAGFDELERSLLDMGAVYVDAMRHGRRDLARYCRRQVISAKDHARLAARNRRTGPARRAEKAEMVEWMLVWLGDPEMFPPWVEIRKRCLQAGAET